MIHVSPTDLDTLMSGFRDVHKPPAPLEKHGRPFVSDLVHVWFDLLGFLYPGHSVEHHTRDTRVSDGIDKMKLFATHY